MDEFYLILRLLNTVIAGLVLVLALVKAHRIWDDMPEPGKIMYISFIALMASIAYGSSEAAQMGSSPGPRVVFVSVALLISLTAFLRPDPMANWCMWWHKVKIPRRVR